MTLKWGTSTVIEKVVSTILEAGITDLVVVTGRYQKEVVEILKDYPVRFIFNPDFEHGEMLSSVKKGISSLGNDSDAALIVLGDQPQTEVTVVHQVVDQYQKQKKKIVVPSYYNHKGHPWLVDKELWREILALETGLTLKDFLNSKQQLIQYVEVDSPSILQDLDTPGDYELYHP